MSYTQLYKASIGRTVSALIKVVYG